jgi:haloalkane dehalogenase
MPDPNWLDRQEYPFQSRYLNLDAGRMHYVDEGQGEPIVMVHGNPAWSFLYRNLIKQLSPKYRCVAMDHLGFGLSDKPADWTYHPSQHADNVATLIQALNLRNVTLVVQDWGGPTGLAYAINHPENVKRIVIMNTWMWAVNRDWYYIGFSSFMGGPLGRFLIKQYNFFVNAVMPMAFADKKKLTPHIHQHYQLPLTIHAERKGCWVFPGQILGATDWLNDLWTRRDALKNKPKLIAWGMKDIAFPEKVLNTWTGAFSDAHVVKLDNVGHFVQEEAVEELGQAVKSFLAK